MLNHRTLLAISLGIALAGCNGTGLRLHPTGHESLARGSSPIIGGSDEMSHEGVGVILYNDQSAGTGFLCSGTLISPNVMLTAGHCTVQDDTCVSPNCQALDAANYQVGGGTYPLDQNQGATWVADVAEVHPHPNYDGNQLNNDVGILILKNFQYAPGTDIKTFAWQATQDDDVYATGTQFLAVGYGIATDPQSAQQNDTSGTKRSVQLQIEDQDSTAFAYGSSNSNTCEGDSGGPAIETINGVETVIGTVSYGDQSCSQYGVDMRTDNLADFIGQYATETQGGTELGDAGSGGNGGNGGNGGGGNPTPTPNPTGTPDPGNGGNGANGGSHVGGCDVASTGADMATSLAAFIGLAAAAIAARRRR